MSPVRSAHADQSESGGRSSLIERHEWSALIRDRAQRLHKTGIEYRHVQLPSRSQLLSDLSGTSLSATSHYLDALPLLRRVSANTQVLDPIEDELTADACYRAAQLLCGALGVELQAGLLGYPCKEQVLGGGRRKRYRMDTLSTLRYASVNGRTLVHSVCIPEQNARVFMENRSRGAVAKTVLVFGQPMVELSRALLGGILAETFRQVHIVASASVDDSLIERLCPDVVISIGRGELTGGAPVDKPGAIAQAETTEPAPSEALRPGSARETVLLAAETYSLSAPITVQPGCVNDVADTSMHTRPDRLFEAMGVRLFFDGGRIQITNTAGEELLRSGLGPNEQLVQEPRRFARKARLAGTSFLLGASSGAHCYYHWMVELLPRLGMLQRHGISLDDINHFLVREITGDWQLETLARLGIARDRIVETRRQPQMRCGRLLHVDHAGGINLKMHRFVPLWLKHLFPMEPNQHAARKLYIARPSGV